MRGLGLALELMKGHCHRVHQVLRQPEGGGDGQDQSGGSLTSYLSWEAYGIMHGASSFCEGEKAEVR